MWKTGVFLLLFIIVSTESAQKIRYKKAKSRKAFLSDESDVFAFLNRITPPKDLINSGGFYDVYEYDEIPGQIE